MLGVGRTVGAVALAMGGVLLIAGCNSGGSAKPTGAATSTTAAMASDVPTGYDPCSDIPQSVLDSLQWTLKLPRKNSAGNIVWRGCGWAKSTDYAVTVYMTNATVDVVRAENLLDPQEFTVDGRRAISTIQDPDHPSQQCTVDVAVKGGSLEVFITNSDASDPAGSADASCQIARNAAQQIVPTLPASL